MSMPEPIMFLAQDVVNRISEFKLAKESLELSRAAWLDGRIKYKAFLVVVQDTIEAERAVNKAMTDFYEEANNIA